MSLIYMSDKKEEPKFKFKLQSWDPIAKYTYNITDTECHICKENLQEPCPECSEKYDTSCVISLMTCGHSFHKHCIEKWRKNADACPIDQVPTEYKKKNMDSDTNWSTLAKK